MNEPSYGLIVEGPYDAAVFPELILKIVSPKTPPEVRPCGGVARLKQRFVGFLREFEHIMQGNPVDKALVVRDCDGRDPAALEQELAEKVRGRQFAFPRGVHFFAVTQKMETWLLADAAAVNAVARERGGRDVPELQGELEDIADPKERFVRLLSQARLLFTPAVCREVACQADIEKLRYRCPSFRSIERKVIDC